MRKTILPPLIVFNALLLGCGGNAARDQALKSAAQARARGDLAGEVEAMRQACGADPKNQDLCRRTGELGEHARATFKAGASTTCSLVRASSPQTIAGCLEALVPLRRLFSDDPDAIRMADAAGLAFGERCGADAPADVPAALTRARCAEAGVAAINTPTYARWVRTTRVDASRVLVELAATREVAGRLGARAAVLSAAACMNLTAEMDQAGSLAVAAFREASAPTLHVRARGISAAELCAATAAALGDRLGCAAAADSRTVVLEANVAVASVQHSVEERTRTERYLAGTDRVENPEYRIRARDELYTREQARSAEGDYRRDQQVCDEAEATHSRASYCYDCAEKIARDSACRHAEDTKAMWTEREDDWNRARSTLEQTPAILEHEDWRDTSFVVRDHAWAAPWEADLRALPGQTARASGVATTGDSEHHGSDLAGVAADPLTPPASGWFVGDVRAQVAASLAQLVGAELAARVSTLRTRCPSEDPAWGDAAWLDCYATAVIVSGAGALGETLIRAESAAADRRLGPGLPALTCH